MTDTTLGLLVILIIIGLVGYIGFMLGKLSVQSANTTNIVNDPNTPAKRLGTTNSLVTYTPESQLTEMCQLAMLIRDLMGDATTPESLETAFAKALLLSGYKVVKI